jgi:enoyl-CoA hydratase/carnithine racemase
VRSVDFEHLVVEATAPVGRITLARPGKLNALGRTTLAELAAAARVMDATKGVKVVIVSGQGASFSAGFDLGDFTNPDPDISMRDGAELGRLMAEAVTNMRALTVAAIRGHCVGGGLVLAASCDLRLASDTTRFSIPEVDLGIPLAWGGIPRLVREIGPALTKELVLTCRPFSAQEAAALHMINRVVPDAELDAAAETLASELAAKPTYALVHTKSHVNAVTEEMGSTAQAYRDADVLTGALADPESRDIGRAYVAARRKG